MKLFLTALAALMLAAPQAPLVQVRVTGLKGSGRVHVALCDKDHFMDPSCPIQKTAPADPRGVSVTFDGVKPGRYAVMVFQDVNGNGKIDFNLVFMPKEPWGISGPKSAIPSFARNAIEVGEGPLSVDIVLRN